MSQNFNYNELIAISKYINHDDYKNYFEIFPTISNCYHSTFNYIHLNIVDINYTLKHLNLDLHMFPNADTLIINVKFKYYKDINILYSIIKLCNKILKLYPNKNIKINILDNIYIITIGDKNKYIECFNKINELIKKGILNNDFKIIIGNYEYKYFFKYKFIIFAKYLTKFNIIDFSKLKHNQAYILFSNRYCILYDNYIQNKNDLKNIYVHKYNNTIFKNLNGEMFAYKNNVQYEYMDRIIYFPSFYKLMKLGIKLRPNKCCNDYVNEYKNKLEINDRNYVWRYLFGSYPLNNYISTIDKSSYIDKHYSLMIVLNNIF